MQANIDDSQTEAALDAQIQEDEAERLHWINVMRTFLLYEDFVHNDLVRRQQHLSRLPEQYADRLPRVSFDKLEGIKHASECNQNIFDSMVNFHFNATRSSPAEKLPTKSGGPKIHPQQHHRNQAVLHSIVREWSTAGAAERESVFTPLLSELQRLLPVYKGNVYRQRVLVPGSGLGRLPLEIAAKGYSSEGNEFSAYMAIASNFMLNGVYDANCYTIHPWIESVCNIEAVQDTLDSFQVPDITATDLLDSFDSNALPADPTATAIGSNSSSSNSNDQGVEFPKFSFSAGDFNQVYRPTYHSDRYQQLDINTNSSSGSNSSGSDSCSDSSSSGADWDAVVTCFFIDTAPVVIEYIETISMILRPGGVWINQGPLLYHWVNDAEGNYDERYEQSIELSYEELKHVIESFGFVFLKEEWKECNYTRFNKSMMWTVYKTVFFSVQKPFPPRTITENS